MVYYLHEGEVNISPELKCMELVGIAQYRAGISSSYLHQTLFGLF